MEEHGLRAVREFVNTYDVEAGSDALADPDRLAGWLREHGLLDAGVPVTAADLRRAVALRESIRDLLTVHHAGSPAAGAGDAATVLTAAADRAGLRPDFTAAGTARLVPTAGGADSAFGRLLALVVEAMADGRWQRLKVCRNDACRWAFYDTSRSGAGKWCSMAVCGNRRKVRAWRARQRGAPPAAP